MKGKELALLLTAGLVFEAGCSSRHYELNGEKIKAPNKNLAQRNLVVISTEGTTIEYKKHFLDADDNVDEVKITYKNGNSKTIHDADPYWKSIEDSVQKKWDYYVASMDSIDNVRAKERALDFLKDL